MIATATRAVIDGVAWNWTLHFGCQAEDDLTTTPPHN
jgi:hypothetical protein